MNMLRDVRLKKNKEREDKAVEGSRVVVSLLNLILAAVAGK